VSQGGSNREGCRNRKVERKTESILSGGVTAELAGCIRDGEAKAAVTQVARADAGQTRVCG
jgi:hypothetical protein